MRPSRSRHRAAACWADEVPRHAGQMRLRRAFAAAVAAGACATAACSGPASGPASAARQLTTLPQGTAAPHGAGATSAEAASAGAASAGGTGPGGPASAVRAAAAVPGRPLPPPVALVPFAQAPFAWPAAGQGRWSPAGRPVSRNGHSIRVVYQTTLIPPGGTQAAGIAWMDAGLLSARLYSGSLSPGGGPYRYTAPIQPAQAATLVAAFNGGFKMKRRARRLLHRGPRDRPAPGRRGVAGDLRRRERRHRRVGQRRDG